MTAWRYDWAAVRVLWRRDLIKLLRRPIWILAALGPAVAVWLLLGLTMTAAGATEIATTGHAEYLFPGAAILVVLQASLLAGAAVLRPARPGLTRFALATPASPSAVMVGKCLGASSGALVPSLLFLLLAPLAGFDLGAAHWPMLGAVLLVSAVGVTATSLAVRSLTPSRLHHLAAMLLVGAPLWLLSGAALPPGASHPILTPATMLNPVAYGVSALRHALYGGNAPLPAVLSPSPGIELLVLVGLCAVGLLSATAVFRRRTGTR